MWGALGAGLSAQRQFRQNTKQRPFRSGLPKRRKRKPRAKAVTVRVTVDYSQYATAAEAEAAAIEAARGATGRRKGKATITHRERNTR